MDDNADLNATPDPSRARATRIRGPERRVATIIFADIVNSSQIFRDQELEEASRQLQQIVDVLTACVGRYNGTVAQEMGDGVMCVFGAPVVEEQHALRACMAARDMLKAAQENTITECIPFQIRVGIATGEVLMRPVENSLRQDFRILGETAHRAAKLQQQAAPNTILIAATTYGFVKTQSNCAALPDTPDAYRLLSVTSGHQSALDLMAPPTAGLMFGRQEELNQLLQLARLTAREQGASVLVTGDPGIGKSRLISEFIRSPELAGWSIVPWPQTVIRSVDARQPLEELADRLAVSAGHHSAVCEAAAVASGTLARAALEECYGIPVSDSRWLGLDPAQRRPFLFEGLIAAIGEFSRSRPLALIIEDAHWAGADALRLMRDLSLNLDDGHILLLVTSRIETEEATPSLLTNPAQIDLQRLSVENVVRYLDYWLGTLPELAKVKQHVLRQCEGVPLYLEESLRCLETDGIIAGDPGDYRLIDPARPIRLANSIRGLIEARIGRLPEPERRTLQHAAAIGSQVHLPILYSLFPNQADVVRTALARLVAGGFLKATAGNDGENQEFRHGLFQEVSYAMLTQDQRRILHARILSVLRHKVSRNLPGRIGLIALHAGNAEDWPLAFAFGKAAGRRAERRCEHASAVEHYIFAREALSYLPPTRRNAQRRIDLLTYQPLALLPQGVRGAEVLLEEAREVAAVIGDHRRHANASSILGSFLWVYGNLDDGITLEKEALKALETPRGSPAEIPILIRLGGMLADKGHCAPAKTYLQRSLTLCAGDIGDRRQGIAAYADVTSGLFLSQVLSELDGPPAGRHCAQQAFNKAMQAPHLFSQLMAAYFLGRACLLDGDDAAAAMHLQASLEIAEAIRCRVYRPLTMAALGLAQVHLDNFKAGMALLNAAAGDAELFVLKRQLPPIFVWNSEAHYLNGEYQRALSDGLKACHYAALERHDGDSARACLAVAKAYNALEDNGKAREYTEKAMTFCEIGNLMTTRSQIKSLRLPQ